MTKIKNGKWLAIAVLAVLLIAATVFALVPAKAEPALTSEVSTWLFDFKRDNLEMDPESKKDPRMTWSENGGTYTLDLSKLKQGTAENGWDAEAGTWDFEYKSYPVAALDLKYSSPNPVYVKFSYLFNLADTEKRYPGGNTDRSDNMSFGLVLDSDRGSKPGKNLISTQARYAQAIYSGEHKDEKVDPVVNGDVGDTLPWTETGAYRDIYLYLPAGEHTIGINAVYKAPKAIASEEAALVVKDIVVQEESFGTVPVKIKYNSRLGELKVFDVDAEGNTDEGRVIAPEGEEKEVEEVTVQATLGKPFMFNVYPKEQVKSTFYDPEKNVMTSVTSFMPHNQQRNSVYPTASVIELTYKKVAYRAAYQSDASVLLPYSTDYFRYGCDGANDKFNYSTYNAGDVCFKDDDDHNIWFDFCNVTDSNGNEAERAYLVENIPILVQARITKNGKVEEERALESREEIVFDAFAEGGNSMLVLVDNGLDGSLDGNWNITVDGADYRGNIVSLLGHTEFTFSDMVNHNVSIASSASVDLKKYNDSISYFSFSVSEVQSNGLGIKNAVTRGNFADPNATELQQDQIGIITKSGSRNYNWFVNQGMSDKNGPYTYRANNSVSRTTPSSSASISTIGFDFSNVTKKGIFSFDFQIKGTYSKAQLGGGQYWGSQACYWFESSYKPTKASTSSFTSGWNTDPYTSKNNADIHKIARIGAGNVIEYGDDVKQAGTWAHFTIAIDPETIAQKPIFHLAYLSMQISDMLGEQSFDIRNICFIAEDEGEAQATVKLADALDGAKVTALINGENEQEVTDTTGKTFSAAYGSVITLKVVVPEGCTFYGWNVNGQMYGNEETYDIIVSAEQTNVIAELRHKGYYQVSYRGVLYQDMNTALQQASASGGEVRFVDDVTISGKLTIPANVDLILPYDALGGISAQGVFGTDITTKPSWLVDEAKYRYLTVTFDNTVELTVEGGLYVGGVVCFPLTEAFMGHTSGAYSELVNNGKITVAEGGVMDVYGRVTGTGSINVMSGAKLLEPFLILDYAGGMNAFSSFGLDHTPFKRYAMNNIECEFTINYGAQLIGHATLYALGSLISLDQPFIGSEKDEATGFGDGIGKAMVLLKKGASVTMTYDAERQDVVTYNEVEVQDDQAEGGKRKEKRVNPDNCVEGIKPITMNFKGGATFSYMVFTAMGISIPTYTVYFSIPYNYNVIMNDGDYETITDFMLMPGSRVEVGKNATLTTRASVWILDGLTAGKSATKSYPSAEELVAAGYSKSGNLIVNGTLKIDQKIDMGKFTVDLGGGIDKVPDIDDFNLVPATFLGVVQTDGTGKIEILANTVLSGTIADGISGQNWFEYQTTARVWDKAHSCFANLTCEQEEVAEDAAPTKWTEYVAKSNVAFTVGSIQYSNNRDGLSKDDVTTMELNQELHGSWMIEHEHHSYVWTPQDGDNFGELSQDNLHKQLTRYCTELGCEESENKELLYAGVLGDLEYNGKDVTEEQLRELFKQLYTEGVEVQTVEISGTAHNAQDGYKVTITLSKDFWLDGEKYVATKELTFNVTKKTITVTAQDQESVYGDKYTIGQTKYDAPELCEGDSLELTIQVQGGADTTNHGEYTLEIVVGTGASNANYNIQPATGTYTVKQRDITVNLPSFSRAYNGKVAAASELGAAVLADGSGLASGDSLEKLVAVSVENAGKDVKAYAVKGSAQAGSDNYNIKFVDGSFVITKVTLTVTAQNRTSVYGQELQALDYDVVGLVNNETKEDVLAQFVKISTNATQGSPVGTGYVITVEWKDDGRPVNYDANFVTGTYTITEAAFAGISLENVTVTYDGETHTLQVKGAPHDAQVVYKLKDQSQVFAGAKNVGKYEVEATVSLANYKSQTFNATLEITVRNITVDLPTFSRDYNGQVPQAGELSATLHQGSTLGKGDQLANIVTLSIEGAAKDAKTYTVTGTQKADATNYKVSFGANGSYTVKPAKLTVTIQPQNKEYDGKDGSIANVANESWVVSTGKVVDGDTLPVVLTLVSQSDNKHAGKYTINGECSDNNYEVTFEGGTDAYTITQKALKVTAHNQTSTYGDEPVAVGAAETYTVEGWIETAPLTVNISHSVTKTSGFKADGYEITVNVPEQPALANYDVTTENGLYTVSKRNVSVTINDQHDTFGFGKEYAWSGDAWTVDEETLAEGETRVDLKVSLAKPQFNGANEYTITGSSANENYNVSFTDGTYTLAKKTIDHDGETVVFTLLVNDDGFNESNPELYVWEGEPIPLAAQVMVKEDSFKELAYTLSVQQLDEVGVFQVVVTIQDDNYQGSHTYTVEVVAEDGFTQNLRNVLAALEEIVGDVTESTLKSTNEHFEMLQKVQQELNKLNDDEKQVGAEKLAVYTALVAAWNDAADLSDNVITTAKTLADAPIKWLFAVAELNALLGALFVLGKGGRV